MSPSNSVGFVVFAIPYNQNSQVPQINPQQIFGNGNPCQCPQCSPSIFDNENFDCDNPLLNAFEQQNTYDNDFEQDYNYGYNPLAENHRLMCLNSAMAGKYARLAITTDNPKARDYFFAQAVSSMNDNEILSEGLEKCQCPENSFKIGFLQNITPTELRLWNSMRHGTFQPLPSENFYHNDY